MGMVGRCGLGRVNATEERIIMSLENLGGEMGGQLGEHLHLTPAFEGGPDLGRFILPKKHGDMYGIPGGRPGPMPPDFGNDMYPVADVGTIVHIGGGVPGYSGAAGYGGDPTSGAVNPSPSTNPLGGFDLSSIFSGNIMGIPTWIILAAAAYFLFFKKGR